MKNTQGLVNALEVVVSNYREHAAEALKSGDSKILVPASLTVEGLDYVTRHPEGIVSQGNEGTEPCYVSLY